MNCMRAPVEVRLAIGKESKVKQVAENLMKMLENTAKSYSMPMGDSGLLESSEATLMPPKKARIDYAIENYMDRCNQDRADKISMKIIQFITGCALPFLVVESSFFIDMLRSLNSMYVDKYLVKANAFTRIWLPKLCAAVKEEMSLLWNKNSDSLRTIGLDGYTTEIQEKVYIFSESVRDVVSFMDIIPQGESRATGNFMGQLMMNSLVKGTVEAGGNADDVEEHYAAVVGDNIASNIAGGKLVEEKYPRVFYNGCRSHCGDLLCEDICSVPSIQSVIDEAHSVAKFINRYSTVKAAFNRIVITLGGGNIPKLLPAT